MNILKRVFGKLPKLPWTRTKKKIPEGDSGSRHLTLAKESLSDLIDEARLPAGILESLAHDYAAVEAMLDKLQHGHLHIAAFGRVRPVYCVRALLGQCAGSDVRGRNGNDR